MNKLRARSRVAARNAPAAFRDEQAPARQANFTLAGIWAEWRDPNGTVVRTCSIVTCAANERMKPYHDRIPVILDPPALAAWIDPTASLPAHGALRRQARRRTRDALSTNRRLASVDVQDADA